MNQQIKNPKTEVPQTPEMNDRDWLNDQLSYEKYLTAGYSIAMNEASHERLYNDINRIFTETQECQRNLYNMMFKKGWYNLEAAPIQHIQKDIQSFTTSTSQLPYNVTLQ